ncbi:MAG: hypothetical protein M0Q88_05120 [Bacilli bacterium]|nr:hypothetical protein [Bacilli bacterium]
MDLKTVELELLKINEEFISYLDKINHESDEKADYMLSDLNLKVDEKSTFIKSLESELIKTDNEIKEKIDEFISRIDNLTKSEKGNKYNLEDVILELKRQKEDELKPFLINQKKKKTELTHKITAQRKELGFLHKENNTKLIEEEKNFKNREIEYTRRMGIDLDRLNEANIKQYSDIEKSILEMEDVKLIREAQRKINSIRLVGIKENLNIKNKYALQNYENALDFKRFQEKIILDNSVLTEEFKQRVKILEYEKELLEDEEALKTALKDFENQLKLKDFERDNILDQLEFEKETADGVNLVNNDVLYTQKEKNKLNYESVEKINSEIYSFDKTQLTEFFMTDKYLISIDKKAVESLITSLRNYILSFKEILIINTDAYISRRVNIYENLVEALVGSKFEKIYGSNLNYDDFKDKFNVIVDEYIKALNASFSKFTGIIIALTRTFEDQLNLTFSLIKGYWQENENVHNLYFKKFSKFLDDGFNNDTKKLKILYENNENNAININNKQKDNYNKQLKDIKDKTKKIINDYNIKKRDILSKIDTYKNELKLKQDKSKKDLNKFIKQSKYKITHFKKVYAENIANHERVEHTIYKDTMKQNKIEYKNRLESIGK